MLYRHAKTFRQLPGTFRKFAQKIREFNFANSCFETLYRWSGHFYCVDDGMRKIVILTEQSANKYFVPFNFIYHSSIFQNRQMLVSWVLWILKNTSEKHRDLGTFWMISCHLSFTKWTTIGHILLWIFPSNNLRNPKLPCKGLRYQELLIFTESFI